MKATLRLSRNLDITSRCLIPSHREMKIKKLDLMQSNQNKESIYEIYKYLRIKFDTLTIKVNQTEFRNLEDFLIKIIEPVIELYVRNYFNY